MALHTINGSLINMAKPLVDFDRWPEDKAQYYYKRGYWINKPLTHILYKNNKSKPDALAIICKNQQISYKELECLSTNLASRIAAYGIGKGDTALVQLPNTSEFFITFFALLKAGVVPLNALYSHGKYELNNFIEQIKPTLLVVSSMHEVFKDDKFIGELKAKEEHPKLILKLSDDVNEFGLSQWIEQSCSESEIDFSATPANEVALFQLSGGSTGTPKLIPRTHNDYYYSVRASVDICKVSSKTRLLCALPAAHNFMLSSPGALGVFYAGGCVVLASDPEPFHCFTLIEKHRVTMAPLVPSAVIAWIDQASENKKNLSSLTLIQVGGANFSESLARQVPQVFDCQLQQVFGMAEGLVNYTRLDDTDEQIFTTQGRPISEDDEILILDEDDKPVPNGAIGILATRGPYTFRGYYKSPAHNSKVFNNEGYYYSGDLVQLTSTGNLRVVGRIKDQINRGGEKISSEEIENLLLSHPDVLDAALVAFVDPNLGEKSCAYVVSRSFDIKPSTLRRYLLEIGIAQYKIPDRFKFIESMPLTAVGKTDKKLLRNL